MNYGRKDGRTPIKNPVPISEMMVPRPYKTAPERVQTRPKRQSSCTQEDNPLTCEADQRAEEQKDGPEQTQDEAYGETVARKG